MKHKIGLVHDFTNKEKNYSGVITKCLCHNATLMFFTPTEGTTFLRDERSDWPWKEAPIEWQNYFDRHGDN